MKRLGWLVAAALVGATLDRLTVLYDQLDRAWSQTRSTL